MKRTDILHIDGGTSGSAGLYLNEIYSALSDNFKQELFVNFYYPFKEGKKIFYRFSELSAPNRIKKRILRLTIRFVELCGALLFSLVYILRYKPKVLNYCSASDLLIEYYFLCTIKLLTKTKIFITCHDVLPFNTPNEKILKKKILKKKRFFLLADKLIIHNQNSREDLEKYYQISTNLIEYPFPIMDLTLLYGPVEKKPQEKFRVSMIGHFRKEKGIDILLEAWNHFYNNSTNVELLLAGNFPYKEDIPVNSNLSIKIIPHFIDDLKYWELIGISDVIVLPYKRGTNSGIPSSIMSLNTLLLASDIPMFKNNKLIDHFFLFKESNIHDLSKKIFDIYSMSYTTKNEWIKKNRARFNQYREEFKLTINDAYLNALKI